MKRTSVRTEILAGITTFLTMSYILVANPKILAAANMPEDGVLTATALGAAAATALMAAFTDYPFALAPGMGLNAFLAYTVCQGLHYDWEIAMAVVVVEGLLVLLLVRLGLRTVVMEALPLSLKHAIGAGIGLFLAFIGLQMGGIVTASPATLVTLGSLAEPRALVFLAGLLLTAALLARGVPGALLLGILGATLVGDLGFHLGGLAGAPVAAPNFSTVWKFWGGLGEVFTIPLVPVLFAFMITDFFDTMGTVVAVGGQAGFVDRAGRMPRLGRVLAVDAAAASIGGALGCSSVTTYLESASGVAAGGRRGLSAWVVAGCFLLAVFLSPLARAVPPAAVAPALVVVGLLMMRSIVRIAWDRVDEALPAFLTIVLTPLTYSIATGVGWGVIAAAVTPSLAGRKERVHPALWACAAVFALSFTTAVPR